MRGVLVITTLICCMKLSAQSTVYSFQLDSIAGSASINFSAFTGKKILIVNTASLDSNATQYAELSSLQAYFADSLVVVIVPSNSFGTEPGSNSEITSFYTQSAYIRFPVAAKVSVTGSSIHPLYAWLTQQSQNGVMNSPVAAPFKKFLINKQGYLVGVFSNRIKPASPAMVSAIQRSK